jgi:hypothetical protein
MGNLQHIRLPEATPSGRTRCQDCDQQVGARRGAAPQRGHSSRRHRVFRAAVVARDPICTVCELAASTVVGHYPAEQAGADRAKSRPQRPRAWPWTVPAMSRHVHRSGLTRRTREPYLAGHPRRSHRDSWTHPRIIGERRNDPGALRVIPRSSGALFGLGNHPDRYGRTWDGDDGEMTTSYPGLTGLPTLRPWWGQKPRRLRHRSRLQFHESRDSGSNPCSSGPARYFRCDEPRAVDFRSKGTGAGSCPRLTKTGLASVVVE